MRLPAEASVLVWPCIVMLPVALTAADSYKSLFPADWFPSSSSPSHLQPGSAWPKPLGLCLGLLAVMVGQFFTVMYHWAHRNGLFGQRMAIQKAGVPTYEFQTGLVTHLAQPEGFVLLGGYLIVYWMMDLMPASYYSFEGGVNWGLVFAQLLLQDCVQYAMHRLEHEVSPELYKKSHKPHHRFTNPKFFDAFNGSPADTILMILVPLLVTSRLIHCNVWTYMAFGTLYANWLTLIHSEYPHPWDAAFKLVGFGTAADHHVHHKLFKYNFSHLFMYWDRACSTYKDPGTVSHFSKGL